MKKIYRFYTKRKYNFELGRGIFAEIFEKIETFEGDVSKRFKKLYS